MANAALPHLMPMMEERFPAAIAAPLLQEEPEAPCPWERHAAEQRAKQHAAAKE